MTTHPHPNQSLDVLSKESLTEQIHAVSTGHTGTAALLTEVSRANPVLFITVIMRLDSVYLYGDRIYKLYELCGSDLGRFIYHVLSELPCQVCGHFEMGAVVPTSSREDYWDRRAARQYGRPNSFWALKNPPTDPNYPYPIVVAPTT